MAPERKGAEPVDADAGGIDLRTSGSSDPGPDASEHSAWTLLGDLFRVDDQPDVATRVRIRSRVLEAVLSDRSTPDRLGFPGVR